MWVFVAPSLPISKYHDTAINKQQCTIIIPLWFAPGNRQPNKLNIIHHRLTLRQFISEASAITTQTPSNDNKNWLCVVVDVKCYKCTIAIEFWFDFHLSGSHKRAQMLKNGTHAATLATHIRNEFVGLSIHRDCEWLSFNLSFFFSHFENKTRVAHRIRIHTELSLLLFTYQDTHPS